MSTLSVTTVNTPNSTTDMTVSTGNTSSGALVLYSQTGGFNLSANSSANVLTVNSAGGILNVPNTLSISVGGSTVATLNSTSQLLSWQLLNTINISNVASVSDTTSFLKGYNEYEIVFVNVLPATNSVTCELQVQVGGVFQTTGYSSVSTYSSGSSVSAIPATTYISPAGLLSSNVVFGGLSGSFHVLNVANTSVIKFFTGVFSEYLAAIYNFSSSGAFVTNTSPITGFQVVMTSGNIQSGTIKVYGRN